MPNHIAGGFVFTGVFASLGGFNILESIPAIAVTLVASVLPDIDHPSSLTGKFVLPISKFINAKFGHRTITHSLLGFLIFTLLFASANNFLFPEYSLTFIAATAYFSHIMLDMTTRAGVVLFYPFLKNSCVMPGRPDMRFKTGEVKSETMVFGFFLFMGIFLYPLMSTGFWTQYNRLFGTPAHLVSEFEKSSDVLLVSWVIKEGTRDVKGQGYCVSAESASKIYLIDRATEQLHKLEGIILETVPEHTDKRLTFENVAFVDVPLDSLNTVLSNRYFQSAHIVANSTFLIHGKQTKSFKEEWLNPFMLQEHNDSIPLKTFIYESNPRIKVLRENLKQAEKEYELRELAIDEYQQALAIINSDVSSASDLVQKQLLSEQRAELIRSEPARADASRIVLLRTQIDALIAADAIKNQKALSDVEAYNIEHRKEQNRYTASLSIIKIK
ncbi:MAG: metal-dependent hydrolase [Bacteroidota bacterium]